MQCLACFLVTEGVSREFFDRSRGDFWQIDAGDGAPLGDLDRWTSIYAIVRGRTTRLHRRVINECLEAVGVTRAQGRKTG